MKKFKKIISMCCAAIMALSMMSIGVFAEEDVTVIEPYSIGETGVIPASYVYYNTELSGVGSKTYSFTINSTEPYFKVWVGNESAATDNPVEYKIVVKKGSTTIDTFYAGPGYMYNGNFFNFSNSQVYNDQELYGPGSYKVIVSNTEGEELKGNISVRREAYEIDG